MLRWIVALVLLAATLSGCSYGYGVLAIALDGRLAFVVSPKSDRQPSSCVRLVAVMVDDRKAQAVPKAGNQLSRVGYVTYWSESVDYDDACASHFPLMYGETLRGRHQKGGITKAKTLRREVVYEVLTATGGGIGGGRFIIHANGHIENLGQR